LISSTIDPQGFEAPSVEDVEAWAAELKAERTPKPCPEEPWLKSKELNPPGVATVVLAPAPTKKISASPAAGLVSAPVAVPLDPVAVAN